MSSSLLLGSIELLNAGAVRLARDSDMGDPAMETASVARLLFDGDVVTGQRAGNRVITLNLLITGATSLARAASIADVVQTVDDTFTLSWTPSDGLPVVFDCFRAQTNLEFDLLLAAQGMQRLTLTIPAAPWTRSPAPVSITPTASTYTLVDSYDTVPTVSGATVATAAAPKVEGTNSTKVTYSVSAPTGDGSAGNPYVPGSGGFTLSRTFGAKDLSASASVGIYANVAGSSASSASQTFALTLTSAGGSKTWTVRKGVLGGSFLFVGFDLSATPTSTSGTLSLAAVTGYSLQFTASTYNHPSGTWAMYVDQLAGYPAGGAGTLTAASGYVRFDNVQGSARTPVSFVVDASSVVQRLLLARSPNPPPGFSPILSAVTTSGGSTANANAIKGTYNAGPVTYAIGATTVRGTYAICVRGYHATGSTITVSAVLTGDAFTQTITAVTTGATTSSTPDLMVVGTLDLPTRDVDGSDTTDTITITWSSSNALDRVDQIYLIDLAGESMLVDTPSVGFLRYWFIDAPSASQQTSKILAGFSSNRSDAWSVTPYLKGPAAFNFDPGSNNLLVVCDKATGTPTITCSYYPRNLYERAS